jgi:hypothetical protein
VVIGKAANTPPPSQEILSLDFACRPKKVNDQRSGAQFAVCDARHKVSTRSSFEFHASSPPPHDSCSLIRTVFTIDF